MSTKPDLAVSDFLMLYTPDNLLYTRLAFSDKPLGEVPKGEMIPKGADGVKFCLSGPLVQDADSADDVNWGRYEQEHTGLLQDYPQLGGILARCVARSPVPLDTEKGRATFLSLVEADLAAEIEKATGLLGYVRTGQMETVASGITYTWSKTERLEAPEPVEVDF